jgi:hypothetical protein
VFDDLKDTCPTGFNKKGLFDVAIVKILEEFCFNKTLF